MPKLVLYLPVRLADATVEDSLSQAFNGFSRETAPSTTVYPEKGLILEEVSHVYTLTTALKRAFILKILQSILKLIQHEEMYAEIDDDLLVVRQNGFQPYSPEDSTPTELDPWRVLASFLFNLGSDVVISIIDSTGMRVDWRLSGREMYSHTTRLRSYIPRIQAAYEALEGNKKLLVARIVAIELSRRADLTDKVRTALARIGWTLEGDQLTTNQMDILQAFFNKGSEHDAYVTIKQILQKVTSSMMIIDGYINSSVFKILATLPKNNMELKLLISKVPPDLALEATKFKKQHPHFSIQIAQTKDVHDRFIVLDNKDCYHLGASIKDAGNKVFMISKIEEQNNSEALINVLNQCWVKATMLS